MSFHSSSPSPSGVPEPPKLCCQVRCRWGPIKQEFLSVAYRAFQLHFGSRTGEQSAPTLPSAATTCASRGFVATRPAVALAKCVQRNSERSRTEPVPLCLRLRCAVPAQASAIFLKRVTESTGSVLWMGNSPRDKSAQILRASAARQAFAMEILPSVLRLPSPLVNFG